MQYFGSHRCGASIISPTFALSAAHCTENIIVSQMGVRAGSATHNSGGTVFPLSAVTNHPEYIIGDFPFDICVLELSQAIVFGVGIQPIALPVQGQTTAAGLTSTVSGWGWTVENGGQLSLILQVIDVPVVDQELCNELYSGMITDNMICAGLVDVGGKDACQADSGGPMVVENQLAGVVSFGAGCARPGFPGVYSRVAATRSWVASLVGF